MRPKGLLLCSSSLVSLSFSALFLRQISISHELMSSVATRREAEALLLPPPPAVQHWLAGGGSTTLSGEPNYALAQEATRWLIHIIQAAYLSSRIKRAGRDLLACYNFTANLAYFDCWTRVAADTAATHALIPELKGALEALGQVAKESNAASNLAILTTANILAHAVYNVELFPDGPATPRNSVRQDALMPSLAAVSEDYDRDWRMQPEHIYIHMLLLVATALNPLFVAAFNALVSDAGRAVDVHGAAIKSFTRMINKLVTADDHRYVEQKPRPAMNIDVVRLLAAAQTPHDILALINRVAAHFGGLSYLKCLPELAATDPAAADARYHMLPVMVTVVFAPKGLTIGALLADAAVRAAWAEMRATRPSAKVSREQWQLDHDTAVKLLETQCDRNEPVRMHCEVQLVTTATAELRHKMHELYKVVRADDGAQLYADVANPGVEVDEVDWNSTGTDRDLLNAADSGKVTTVQRLLEGGGRAGGGGGGGGGGSGNGADTLRNAAEGWWRAIKGSFISIMRSRTLVHAVKGGIHRRPLSVQ